MFSLLFASKTKLYAHFLSAWKKGDFNTAVKLGQRLIFKDNNDYKNLNDVAMVYYKLGLYDHALNYLLKANIIKEKASHWENIARVQQALKNFKRAIKSYNKALELKPRKMSVWYNLSRCYKSQNDLKAACYVLTKLILVYPDNMEARIDLGLYLLLQGKVDKAKIHFDSVISTSNGESNKNQLLNKLIKYRTKPFIKDLLLYYQSLNIN